MQWFYAIDGEQRGPVSPAEIARLIARGTVDNETLVWREGFTAWEPWGQVGGANSLPTGDTPPPLPATDGLARDVCLARGAEQKWSVDEFSRRLEQQGMTTSVGGCLKRAWKNYKANFGLALAGATLVAIIIQVLASSIWEMENISGKLLGLLLQLFILPHLTAGCGWLFLARDRGDPVGFNAIFEGFKRCYGKLVVVEIVYGCIASPLLPLMIAVGWTQIVPSPEMVVFLFILGVILAPFGIWLLLRFMFAYLIILDWPVLPLDAFALSWRITRGRTGTLLGLMLLLGVFLALLFVIPGDLPLAIELFLIGPVVYVVLAQYYHDVYELAASRSPA